MAKTRLTAIGRITLGCLVLAACADGNVHTASYATLSEARQAGAVDRGWVSGALPDGAYELRAAYEVDGERRWGLFNFRPADEPALRAILAGGEVSVSGVTMDIPPRIEWWPVQLRGRLDEERILATGLRAYRSTDGAFTFLVNWKQGRAYYWRTAEK